MTNIDKICNDALDIWGHDTQMDIVIEELSELIQAIIKHRRYPNEERAFDMAEELGDVCIMISQLEISMKQKYPDFTYWKDGSMQAKLNHIRLRLDDET